MESQDQRFVKETKTGAAHCSVIRQIVRGRGSLVARRPFVI